MVQLAIMNQKVIILDDRRSGEDGADRRLQYGHYDQLIRVMSIEDSHSFFNYMRMEPLRIGPRIQKSNTNSRRALELDLSWPERQKVAEAWQKRQG